MLSFIVRFLTGPYHAKIHRTKAVLSAMPPLLLDLWREQHLKGHEYVQLDFTSRKAAAKLVTFFRRGQSIEVEVGALVGLQANVQSLEGVNFVMRMNVLPGETQQFFQRKHLSSVLTAAPLLNGRKLSSTTTPSFRPVRP